MTRQNFSREEVTVPKERITVRTQVPLLGPYLGAGALEVSGNAYEFD